MPFLSISGTGIKIVLSSPLTILTCSVIPKDDIYLGMTTIALLLLCFLQIYAFKEVPYSSLSQQKPAQTPRLRAVFETGGIYKHYSGSSNTSFKNPEDDDDLFEDIPDWTWLEITITGLAAVTVVVSIGAVLISTSRIVLVNGLVALLIPPYSAFQEQKITECKAIEKDIERKDREMNNLNYENERLEVKAEDYEKTVTKIEGLKDVIEDISKMKNTSLGFLEEQLKQSQQIIDSIQVDKLSSILANVFDIMLADDIDGDMSLSDSEIDNIIKTCEGLNKVDIDDEKAKRMIIDAGRGIDAVIGLIKDMLDNDPTTGSVDKDEIIHYL